MGVLGGPVGLAAGTIIGAWAGMFGDNAAAKAELDQLKAEHAQARADRKAKLQALRRATEFAL